MLCVPYANEGKGQMIVEYMYVTWIIDLYMLQCARSADMVGGAQIVSVFQNDLSFILLINSQARFSYV